MRLKTPCPSIRFSTQDVYGNTIDLSAFEGKRVMLSFFRDAACPFCNFRIYELTNNYKAWKDAGLEIVAVFSSTSQEVRQYVANHPRPFHLIADPNLELYNQYGVEHSSKALFKAMLFKIPRIIKGFRTGGRPSNNPHVKIVPADFLLDTDGSVVECWYGRDTADHIPLDRVQRFVDELKQKLITQQQLDLNRLLLENNKLKKKLTLLLGKLKSSPSSEQKKALPEKSLLAKKVSKKPIDSSSSSSKKTVTNTSKKAKTDTMH